MIFEVGGPGEEAFDAGGVRGDDPYGGEGDSELGEVIFHELEPLVSDVAGAAAHVGEDDVGLSVGKYGEEDVEPGIGVDVDLLGLWEIVAERAQGFVFRIEVEREKGNLAGVVPVGDGEGDTGFADPTLTAGGEDDTFLGVMAA